MVVERLIHSCGHSIEWILAGKRETAPAYMAALTRIPCPKCLMGELTPIRQGKAMTDKRYCLHPEQFYRGRAA